MRTSDNEKSGRQKKEEKRGLKPKQKQKRQKRNSAKCYKTDRQSVSKQANQKRKTVKKKDEDTK